MVQAYILIQTEVGKAAAVADAISALDGVAQAELIGIDETPDDDGDDRPLLVPLVTGGEVVAATDVETARAHHAMARAELPLRALRLSHGDPAIPTTYLDDWS